jgi:hypothetical protein
MILAITISLSIIAAAIAMYVLLKRRKIIGTSGTGGTNYNNNETDLITIQPYPYP